MVIIKEISHIFRFMLPNTGDSTDFAYKTKVSHSLPKRGDYFHSFDLSVPWTWLQALDIIELSHHSPSRHELSFQSFLLLFMASKGMSILCLLVNSQIEGNNA